ncbi:hypothetical protein [Roseicella sp. DB1501]|uniref:hypothetical protein n=1 Tax=Roseicella sp. DB1501 TaxID=2730925 RepID=UPI00149271B3|nr:hypothetical protein [Roseicella sp. DB1501]NOG73635.1 hypothetical protein [Roseicella sp. DB1501]
MASVMVAAALVMTTMAVPAAVMLATMMVAVMRPVVVPGRHVVMAVVTAAPVARTGHVRRGTVGWVGGRPAVIGLSAGGNGSQ